MWSSDVGTRPLRAVLHRQESNRIMAEALDIEHVSTLQRRAVLEIHTQTKGALAHPASQVQAARGVDRDARAPGPGHPDDGAASAHAGDFVIGVAADVR